MLSIVEIFQIDQSSEYSYWCDKCEKILSEDSVSFEISAILIEKW